MRRGALTSSNSRGDLRTLPDYLLIGAQKAGTMFVQAMLMQHPAIVAGQRELHFFDRSYDRGTAWYSSQFPTIEGRERMVRQQGEFATGERTPSYLFDPLVPKRVAALLPEIRLLVMLRDPVARALSHYQHNRRRGSEHLSFEDAVACELDQREGRGLRHPHRSYLARGLYAAQLERWFAHFDRQQLHLTVSERLFADPAPAVREIQQFIGVAAVEPDDLTPRHQFSYPPMSAALTRDLRDFFSADAEQLMRLLPDFGGWWETKRPKEPAGPAVDFAGEPAGRLRCRGPFGTTQK